MKDIIATAEARTQDMLGQLPHQLRPWSLNHNLQKDRGIMITGPRGVGKTTFLLAQMKTFGKGLYVSADHPRLSSVPLWQLGEAIFTEGYDLLVIDEIHYASGWGKDIKALYDSFPQKKLWISDSSSLVLRLGTTDLSRRLPRLVMPLLSFREYMILITGKNLPAFNAFIGEQPDLTWRSIPSDKLLANFKQYLKEGARPIFTEGRYVERSLAIIEKMIFSDVPFFLNSVQKNYLNLMNAVIGHLTSTPVPTVNVDSLARDWGIGKPKIYELLTVMQELELLTIVRKKSDHSSGKGAKLLLADHTWYAVLNGNTGSQREAFVASMLRGSGASCFAADDETESDFKTPWGLVEVGGANKKRKNAKFVVRDDIYDATPTGGIPLWMVGALY